MSIYRDVINWSSNKPLFIQDAIRRLLINPILEDSDVNELILILKKEVGFTGIKIDAIPATHADIPSLSTNSSNTTKLLSIENPVNINALWNEARLHFAPIGLTLIYGQNGSGKSSYTRLLKKLCWSRHKNVELKTNVFTRDASTQSVRITFSSNGSDSSFAWWANQPTHSALNSVYLFDSHCASIYLNNENITEYKPLGVDILESLAQLCQRIDVLLDNEARTFIVIKPVLDGVKYGKTVMFNWYSQVENKVKEEIENTLTYTEENVKRKQELITILQTSNPLEVNKNLQLKISRYSTVKTTLLGIERFFAEENTTSFVNLKKEFITKRDAYLMAQDNLKGTNPLKGVGSETWRALWEAAKKYATTEIHPENKNYPESESSETCVLCQQSLSEDAKKRLSRFNTFVMDTTSRDFIEVDKRIKTKMSELESLTLQITDTFEELKQDIPIFEENLTLFLESFSATKIELIEYLRNEDVQDFDQKKVLHKMSGIIENKCKEFEDVIIANKGLIENRAALEKELLEIEALEFLVTNKNQIIQYNNEYCHKWYINQCKLKTNTRAISIKIGDVLENQAIELQHQEFISHLQSLAPLIADKISIKKTRTSGGQTFQKCGFRSISESLPLVLSEGEQKIVAFANFLSECTIGGSNNTIIFDDPVNSLDQNYREAIAKKIVELSLNRQIVVLTHDLYFFRLLMDIHKETTQNDCHIVGLMQHRGQSGIPSDEIPYLAKNVQQRIETIRADIAEINSLDANQAEKVEPILERARQRMRKLLERSVEELLTNHTIQRFSKNIQFKRGNLANLVVVEKDDIDFVLSLFGKYSIAAHDGSIETIPIQPNETIIQNDLRDFSQWMNTFKERARVFKQTNGYT
jgi:energy-coupling factor transporter ATP-binding protein EcfA2